MNLGSEKLLDRTQTGVSNLVDIPTIERNYKAKVMIIGVVKDFRV